MSDSYRCPHIVSSDEGTSYCSLAEKRIRELEETLAEAVAKRDNFHRAWRTVEEAGKRYQKKVEELDTENNRYRDALHRILENERDFLSDPINCSGVSGRNALIAKEALENE